MTEPDKTSNSVPASDVTQSDSAEMAMPSQPAAGQLPDAVSVDPTPPRVGLQVAQLVVIPAVIVVACIIMAVLFGMLAGAKDSIDTHLLKLRQSSGSGKLAMGLQDPRYKDRGLAAYNIATMIPKIEDPQERLRISTELIEILDEHTADHEQLLQSYLLLAIGQLGQSGGLETIVKWLKADHPQVRQGAIGAILSWPDRQAAKSTLSALRNCLTDQVPMVRVAVAAAIGQLAEPGDAQTITVLRDAMESSVGLEMREAKWNAAVSLARLGDTGGSRFVASLLLDRQALGQMPADETGPGTQEKMADRMADRVMLATLASATDMNDQTIWDKITQIADNDPSRPVRNAAKQLLLNRQRDDSKATE